MSWRRNRVATCDAAAGACASSAASGAAPSRQDVRRSAPRRHAGVGHRQARSDGREARPEHLRLVQHAGRVHRARRRVIRCSQCSKTHRDATELGAVRRKRATRLRRSEPPPPPTTTQGPANACKRRILQARRILQGEAGGARKTSEAGSSKASSSTIGDASKAVANPRG